MAIKQLYTIVLYLSAVAFVIADGALIYAQIRSARASRADAERARDSRAWEVIWTVIPGLVLLALILMK